MAHGPAKGIGRWLFTTNHKDIGTLYLWFSFSMFLLGGFFAMVIRAELFEPGMQIVKPEFFNQMTTMHGLVMVLRARSIAWQFSVDQLDASIHFHGCVYDPASRLASRGAVVVSVCVRRKTRNPKPTPPTRERKEKRLFWYPYSSSVP